MLKKVGSDSRAKSNKLSESKRAEILLAVSAARERVNNVRNCLSTCKQQLQCKRDQLKKLWLESAEQKHAQIILEQVSVLFHSSLRVD